MEETVREVGNGTFMNICYSIGVCRMFLHLSRSARPCLHVRLLVSFSLMFKEQCIDFLVLDSRNLEWLSVSRIGDG